MALRYRPWLIWLSNLRWLKWIFFDEYWPEHHYSMSLKVDFTQPPASPQSPDTASK